MKNLLLLAFIICSSNCFSQNPNPLLFQTWYLRSVQNNDLDSLLDVSLIVPSITPTLTISNTLDFTGIGACNTFNGVFTNVTNSSLQSSSFSDSGLNCSTITHNQFEDSYFYFLQSSLVGYNILNEGSGLVLMINNALLGTAIFQNYSLKTTEFDIERIAIYPNPSKSVIYIHPNQLVITKIQIINSLGQNVKTIIDDFEIIDIANLSSAIYTLKIDTEIGTVCKKIVKE